MFTRYSPTSSHYSLYYFERGETTIVTVSVSGAPGGSGATCSFTVFVAGIEGMSVPLCIYTDKVIRQNPPLPEP